MKYINYILCALLVWNLIVFLLYGADKRNAKKSKRRISEKTLLVTAFFMGGLGAFFGMIIYRHKTKHLKFKILFPLFAILNIAVVIGVYIVWLA